jgi:hypothetical protein
MSGRRPKLTYPQLAQLDQWMARRPGCRRNRKVPIWRICQRLNISDNTVYDAYLRRGAYRDCPKRETKS